MFNHIVLGAKLATQAVVGLGVTIIVKSIIDNNVEESDNKAVEAAVNAATIAVAGTASHYVANYTNHMIDLVADAAKPNRHETNTDLETK